MHLSNVFSFLNNLNNDSSIDGAGSVNYVMNKSIEMIAFKKQAFSLAKKVRDSFEF